MGTHILQPWTCPDSITTCGWPLGESQQPGSRADSANDTQVQAQESQNPPFCKLVGLGWLLS